MTTTTRPRRRLSDPAVADWAVILGASSGFGKATALELAAHGFNICGVHLDRKQGLEEVHRLQGEIRDLGVRPVFFNVNAADAEKRQEVIAGLQKEFHAEGGGAVKVLLHSLAFGTLKPYLGPHRSSAITQAQMEMTLDVMANSLVYWVQDLMEHSMMARGAHVYAMTSEGDQRVWATYGAVSAAKAALESHIRQLAYELAPHGITANAIRAGVTDTPALRKIPGSEHMIAGARKRNPYGRMTTPQDVAKAIAALSVGGTHWVTGNVIGVDGGEFIVG